MLIEELKVIESELDRYLDGEVGSNNKFLHKILAARDYEAPDREKVFS